jgi:hypothetical protein
MIWTEKIVVALVQQGIKKEFIMPCTGGGPGQWEIDLKEQERVTEKNSKTSQMVD